MQAEFSLFPALFIGGIAYFIGCMIIEYNPLKPVIFVIELLFDLIVFICVGGGELLGYLWKTITPSFIPQPAPTPTDILVEMIALKTVENPTLGKDYATRGYSGAGYGPLWLSEDRKVALRFELDSKEFPRKVEFLLFNSEVIPISDQHKQKLLEALLKSDKFAREAEEIQRKKNLELLACDAIASLSPKSTD